MINKILGFKIANIVMFVGTLIVNYLTINGVGHLKSIGNVSGEYDTLITPPSWAFSIWGLIYVGLLLFSICQFVPQFNLDRYVKNISILFILSCLFNMTWIIAFSLGTPISITVSVFLIFGLLTCLLLIEKRCNFFSYHNTKYEIAFVDVPFSLYLGWIMIATILNVVVCIKAWLNGTSIENENIYYVVILIIAAILYLVKLVKNNYVTLLVFFYVLISLSIKHSGENTLFPFTILIMCFTFVGLLLKIFLTYCKSCEFTPTLTRDVETQ